MSAEKQRSIKSRPSPDGSLKLTIKREKPPEDDGTREWVSETRGDGVGKIVLKRKNGSLLPAVPSPTSAVTHADKQPEQRTILRLSFTTASSDGGRYGQVKTWSLSDVPSAVEDIASTSELSPACQLQPSPKDSGIDMSSPPHDDGAIGVEPATGTAVWASGDCQSEHTATLEQEKTANTFENSWTVNDGVERSDDLSHASSNVLSTSVPAVVESQPVVAHPSAIRSTLRTRRERPALKSLQTSSQKMVNPLAKKHSVGRYQHKLPVSHVRSDCSAARRSIEESPTYNMAPPRTNLAQRLPKVKTKLKLLGNNTYVPVFDQATMNTEEKPDVVHKRTIFKERKSLLSSGKSTRSAHRSGYGSVLTVSGKSDGKQKRKQKNTSGSTAKHLPALPKLKLKLNSECVSILSDSHSISVKPTVKIKTELPQDVLPEPSAQLMSPDSCSIAAVAGDSSAGQLELPSSVDQLEVPITRAGCRQQQKRKCTERKATVDPDSPSGGKKAKMRDTTEKPLVKQPCHPTVQPPCEPEVREADRADISVAKCTDETDGNSEVMLPSDYVSQGSDDEVHSIPEPECRLADDKVNTELVDQPQQTVSEVCTSNVPSSCMEPVHAGTVDTESCAVVTSLPDPDCIPVPATANDSVATEAQEDNQEEVVRQLDCTANDSISPVDVPVTTVDESVTETMSLANDEGIVGQPDCVQCGVESANGSIESSKPQQMLRTDVDTEQAPQASSILPHPESVQSDASIADEISLPSESAPEMQQESSELAPSQLSEARAATSDEHQPNENSILLPENNASVLMMDTEVRAVNHCENDPANHAKDLDRSEAAELTLPIVQCFDQKQPSESILSTLDDVADPVCEERSVCCINDSTTNDVCAVECNNTKFEDTNVPSVQSPSADKKDSESCSATSTSSGFLAAFANFVRKASSKKKKPVCRKGIELKPTSDIPDSKKTIRHRPSAVRKRRHTHTEHTLTDSLPEPPIVCRRNSTSLTKSDEIANSTEILDSETLSSDVAHIADSLFTSGDLKHIISCHQQLMSLRKKVCELLKTLFPELQYPHGFRCDLPCVERLLHNIVEMLNSDCAHVQVQMCSDPVVSVHQMPDECLRDLQQLVLQLLTALLPNVNLTDIDTESLDIFLEIMLSANQPLPSVFSVLCPTSVPCTELTCQHSNNISDSLSLSYLRDTDRDVQHESPTTLPSLQEFHSSTVDKLFGLSTSLLVVNATNSEKRSIRRQVKDCLMFLDRDLT